MQPWEIYYEDFRRRARRVPEQAFSRDDAFMEAAHEAYRATLDRIGAEDGVEDDHALRLGRGFNQVVKGWIGRPGYDWDALREQLRRSQERPSG